MRAALLLAVAFLGACAGSARERVFAAYSMDLKIIATRSAVPLVLRRRSLESRLAAATALDIPPGVRAHAGLLAAQAGDRGAAESWFESEADAYPDARTFMTRLQTRGPTPVITTTVAAREGGSP
jgi:hypothetical protein